VNRLLRRTSTNPTCPNSEHESASISEFQRHRAVLTLAEFKTIGKLFLATTIGSHTIGSHTIGSHTIGSHTIGSHTIGSHTIGSNVKCDRQPDLSEHSRCLLPLDTVAQCHRTILWIHFLLRKFPVATGDFL
jgi:hypothetical protein